MELPDGIDDLDPGEAYTVGFEAGYAARERAERLVADYEAEYEPCPSCGEAVKSLDITHVIGGEPYCPHCEE